MEKRKDTMPMITIGDKMDDQVVIPIKANEIPTANASILVAMAKVKMTGSLVGSK